MAKRMGKIIEFDGFSGQLIDLKENKKHIFSNDDLITKELKVNDLVSYESETYSTIDNTFYVARFVKKVQE